MFKIILALLVVGSLGYSGQYILKNQCSCDQLLYQSDCTAKGQMCTWNGNTCSTTECSKVTDSKTCASNLNCMWQVTSNGASCTQFTFCSQLEGSSQQQCLKQSYNCPYTDGKKCGDNNQLHSCSYFKESQYCEGYISQEGVCMWKGTCQPAQSCTPLNQDECALAPYGCKYSTTNGCTQLTCSDYTTQQSCTLVMLTIYKGDIQLCSWDSNAGKCSAASNLGGLGQGNCYQYTLGTARWISNTNGGECQPCYAHILFAFIATLFIIMI